MRDVLRISEMMKTAADVRMAGEAFDRFGKTLGEIAASLATMSREFDPLGYKAAFRIIGHQNEVIQQQHEFIRGLQARESERLRDENELLRKRIERLQKRKQRKAN